MIFSAILVGGVLNPVLWLVQVKFGKVEIKRIVDKKGELK